MVDDRKIKTLFIVEGVVTLIILINVIYLNIVFFKIPKSAQTTSVVPLTAQVVNPTATPTATPSTSSEQATPTTKVPTSSPTPKPTTTPVSANNDSSIKDYFVPLGSGSSQATDWADVAGAQVAVDFGQYKSIKSIVFEASVSVPTANQSVYVRLYNVTDKHPVWNSEVNMTGSSSYLVSNPITYDTGSKTYQVQIKTQLGSTANLTQSRIHISLN